jgi:hypothetical protein
MSDTIPQDVAEFILEKIESVAHIEALLLFRSGPDEQWSVEAFAKRLYISDAETTQILDQLCADGFLISKPGEPARYSYRPSSPELESMVERVYEAYSKHLMALTNLIHSKPKTGAQRFADAFRLRKDK